MRTRLGNPHNEAHGQAMRVVEWIAPSGTDPTAIPAKLEAALVGLKLFHRGDNQQNGFVSTSTRPDGSVYVAVHLYQQPCAVPNCPAGHGPVAISVLPVPSAAQLTALVAAVGENLNRVISGVAGDTATLQSLGFRQPDAASGFPGDAPFR